MWTTRFLIDDGKWARLASTICCIALLSVFASCEFNQYETGDGQYSYLRADFVEVHTLESQQIDYAINDDGKKIVFDKPYSVKWAETKDSLYRALLYYNRKPDKAELVSVQRVHVLRPLLSDSVKNPKTDPVTLESTWTSECQRTFTTDNYQKARYLNVSFYVKTGQHDADLVHTIGVMSENRNDTLRLTLLHDQGGIPEYYSSRVYASIPLLSSKQEGSEGNFSVVRLAINTYQGENIEYFPQ